MTKAIILFVRHPEAGKVKTRLAGEIGNSAALRIYTQLLKHTHDITVDIPFHKFVFYADKIIETDIWENEKYYKRAQAGNDLGERMKRAFAGLFERKYEKILIIGSDCPGLSPGLIEEAFDLLNHTDVVIGPAADGGYYLLGLNYLIEDLFRNKKWSTATVLQDSLKDLANAAISYSSLPVLQDIDTKQDLDQLNYFAPG